MTALLIILFGLAILGGIYLLSYVLRERNMPKGIALIHGSVAGLALITLIVASFFHPKLFYVVIIFILAALGGGILFTYDLGGKKIPKILALGHGLIALAGFVTLVIILFQY